MMSSLRKYTVCQQIRPESHQPTLSPNQRCVQKIFHFVLGGTGDARHSYTTWMELNPALLNPPNGALPKSSFEINDYDSHVFARNLILWDLIA